MEQSPLISIGLPVALFVIMMGIGLTLTAGDFHREARQPRGVIVGTLAQLLMMPALGFAIAALLRLPPAIAVGLVIVAACPGGSTSNLVAYLARANVALSIVLTVLASVAAIATLPLYVNLALAWQPAGAEVAVRMPVGQTVALLVGIILVPVGIGMMVRRRAPERAASLEKAVSLFGGVVLVLLIAAIVHSVRDRFWELIATAGPAAILLNLGGIAAGWLAAAAAGLSAADRLTAGIELGVKNSTIGMLVAITVIGSDTMAVPSAVYGLLMYASAFALVAYGQRTLAPLEARRARTLDDGAAPGTADAASGSAGAR
ncbi:MAG TPA: bile acid:sodium symporter family protein [Longimicrobiaceae bacterium]|nr:bile acid:sodium symporter family protein [Longimicrobiaceae bacterium]